MTNEQEESIPKDPIRIAANKKLISIWYEAKKQIDTELYAQKHYTTEEQEAAAKPDRIKVFFKDTVKILERWMKVMCHEEGDIISALTIDQLFKSVLLKLDSVFSL